MKILHLISTLGIGGAEKFVVQLSVQQKANGNSVFVLALDSASDVGKDTHYENAQIDYLKSNGVIYIKVGGSGRKNPLNVGFQLRKYLSEIKPDIVHSHMALWSLYLSFLNWKSLHVFTQHINRLKFPFLHKYILSHRIDKYICICEEAYVDMKKYIPIKKIKKIINGINIDGVYTKRLDFTRSNKIRFLFVGRLTYQKNINLLIEALSKLRIEGFDNFSLSIVGDGEDLNNLQNLVAVNNLPEYISFLGVRKDINLLLSNHDVFILPSRYEGYSIALIEALCSGIFVIASEVGGNADILNYGEFGCVFKNDNLVQLTNLIREILSFRTKDARDPVKLQSYINKFSINECARLHDMCYSE